MSADGAPLDGLRVVECATFIAVPFATLALAQLGAEVIRIDPIGGAADHRRWPLTDEGVSLYWAGLNKQKRSVALDLRSDEGRELAVALATQPGPDNGIFVSNQGGQAWQSYDALRARRSDLIYLRLTGRPDGAPAIDYMANARAGFPLVTGPGPGPTNHVLPAWDVIAGMHAATALLAADRRRRRHGTGQLLTIALTDVAVATAGHLGLLAEAERGVDRGPDGNYVYGTFGRDFLASDGRRVVVVAVTDRQWRAVVDCAGAADDVARLATRTGETLADEGSRYRCRHELAKLLEPWFASLPAAEVRRRLAEAGGLCEVYLSFRDLVAEHEAGVASESPGLLTTLDLPGVGEHLAPASPVRWSTGAAVPVRAPAAVGHDTRAVLEDVLGLGTRELGALASRHVIPF